MTKDLEAIFNQMSRLDAMANVAGGNINDQAAITKQMVQLMTALRKTRGSFSSNYANLRCKQDVCQKVSVIALIVAAIAFFAVIFK